MKKGRLISVGKDLGIEISEVQQYAQEEWDQAVNSTSLYDDGADHYLMELDNPVLFSIQVNEASRKIGNDMELGTQVRKIVTEVIEYTDSLD